MTFIKEKFSELNSLEHGLFAQMELISVGLDKRFVWMIQQNASCQKHHLHPHYD